MLRTLAYRRISVRDSAVVVWVCKDWEKDSNGNGTNLGLFRHLLPSKSVTYRPLPHGYVSPVSLTACLSCCPNTVCCSSESYPRSDRAVPYFNNYGAARMGHGFLGSKTEEGLRWGGDVDVEFGLMTHGMYSQRMNDLNRIMSLIITKPKYSLPPKRNFTLSLLRPLCTGASHCTARCQKLGVGIINLKKEVTVRVR
jgi:hypothetical protein